MNMNHAVKIVFAAAGPQHTAVSLGAVASFHSTRILERKRKTYWNSKFNNYSRRSRKMESKRALFHNVSQYAEYLFQSWRDDDDRDAFSPFGGPSWLRDQFYRNGTKKHGFNIHGAQGENYRHKRKVHYDFCTSDDDDADDDVETIFRTAFGGERYYYWSFDCSEDFHWRHTYTHGNQKRYSNRRFQTDDETNSSLQSDLAPERLSLGLSAAGPLSLEDVKSAYRACALKWHPDRHQGSSKVAAEEKFKHCSAAYQLLCDRLAPN